MLLATRRRPDLGDAEESTEATGPMPPSIPSVGASLLGERGADVVTPAVPP